MQKNYEADTQKAIEQVICVFQDYIKASPHFDLLCSDKVGYIFISVDPIHRTVADSDSWVVECAEDLLDKLLYEMAVDNGVGRPFLDWYNLALLNLRVIENYRLSKPAHYRKMLLY